MLKKLIQELINRKKWKKLERKDKETKIIIKN